MPLNCLRIATRKSQLALWQAEHIRDQLTGLHPELKIDIIPMSTQGDEILDKSLSKIGGKGLFTKELEHALLQNRADIAVHCVKDMPYAMVESLDMPVICQRGSPWDALVSPNYDHIEQIPTNGIVGTSSLRRQAQLLALRPDLNVLPLRGNLNTRLRKLDEGQFDAIILAAAGLERLGWSDRIKDILPSDHMLPAVGQGALGIQMRVGDTETFERISPLHHHHTAICIMAERAMNTALAGSCQVPIGGYAYLESLPSDTSLVLSGLVAKPCGTIIHQVKRITHQIDEQGAVSLGKTVAQELIDLGANQILHDLKAQVAVEPESHE